MTIGIVGSEAAKFTADTEAKARKTIRELIAYMDKVISGGCHLGGIDIWAIEEAKAMNKETQEFVPVRRRWEGGYKERNLKIAMHSDTVVCITVEKLPDSYTGMRFEKCYHCPKDEMPHVKSGGCWTLKQARKLKKATILVVIK